MCQLIVTRVPLDRSGLQRLQGSLDCFRGLGIHRNSKIWHESVLITNPEKNALIHPIMRVCETIIATLPFIIPIMPSIMAGSVIGLGGGWPRFSGSARNAPFSASAANFSFRARNAVGDMACAFARKLAPRISDRCSRIFGDGCFF